VVAELDDLVTAAYWQATQSGKPIKNPSAWRTRVRQRLQAETDRRASAEATLRVHVSTLLRLLDVENRTQAATSAVAHRLLDE